MVGYAGSPTRTVYVGVTFTRSKVKVNLTGSDFEFPSTKAIRRVQTSPNVDSSRNSNGRISVVRDATVTWLLNFRQLAKPCMLAAMTAAPLWGFLVSDILLMAAPCGLRGRK